MPQPFDQSRDFDLVQDGAGIIYLHQDDSFYNLATRAYVPIQLNNYKTLPFAWSDGAGSQIVKPDGTLAPVNNAPLIRLREQLRQGQPITAYQLITTTLSADINSAVTSIGVTTAAGFPSLDNFVALLNDGTNSEYIWVYAGLGSKTWTAVRGYNGSTANAFTAALTTISWYPVAFQKGTLNDNPMGYINFGSVTFTGSVGGASSGTLTGAVQNGTYTLKFSNGNVRQVKVQGGTAVTWTPALTAGAVTTATVSKVALPTGDGGGYNPATIALQRFDLSAPVYITQSARLAKRPAVVTANYGTGVLSSISVDSTSMFPQAGTFVINVAGEDMVVSVLTGTTLKVLQRAFNGTSATAVANAATVLNAVYEVDFLNGGGTQAYWTTAPQNSGTVYLGVALTIGALREYSPQQPMCMHFTFDGQVFEILCAGDVSFFMIADGVVMHAANYLQTSGGGAGAYWHKFDFGSRKTRKITMLTLAYVAAVSYSPEDTMLPWDRSADPIFSFNADSYAQTEGYTWLNTANGGGLGLYLEMMLDLGITQYDLNCAVGGSGYLAQGAAVPPSFPRPKYSTVNRVGAFAGGPAPTWFFDGNGHNDNTVGPPAGIVNSSTLTTPNATNTQVLVSSNTGYPITTLPFIAACGTELLLVTAVNGLIWTVTRGYGSTTAASHAAATLSAATPSMFSGIAGYYQTLRAAWPLTVMSACHFYEKGREVGAAWYVRAAIGSAILYGLQQGGGSWVYLDLLLGTWQNSSLASGNLASPGTPVLTGTGYGTAPGYAGTTGVNDGNADLMIRDDDIHPSNLGARYFGSVVSSGFRSGVLAL